MISQGVADFGGHHRAAPGRRGGYRVRQGTLERASGEDGRGGVERIAAHLLPSGIVPAKNARRVPPVPSRVNFTAEPSVQTTETASSRLPAGFPGVDERSSRSTVLDRGDERTSPVLEKWMSGLYACRNRRSPQPASPRGCTATNRLKVLFMVFVF